jgi:vitamin B12 transporter
MGVSIMCVNLVGIFGGWLAMIERAMAGSTVTAAEPTRLDPVVVTGTQIAVPVSELPSAITVIDREEIESRQVTDVLQLLRTVPELSVTQTGSRGGLTDVFPRGGNSNFNLVLVDGVPVNNAGGRYDFSDLTTDNIERIEVIRGPQSALYGSNAIGGVIQIFTRRGRGPFQGDISLAAGTFNIYEGHGVVSGGSDRFGASLGVGYVSTSGFLPINNDYRDFTISSSLDYEPIEALKLAFSARYSDSRFENPTESAGDRLSPLDPDQFQDRQRLTLALRGTHAVTRWWEQVLLLGLSRVNSLFRDPFNPPIDFADSKTNSDEQRLFLNYVWNMSLPEFYQVGTTLSLGIEAQGESFDQRSTFGTTTNSLDRSRSQQGYYTQALFNWRQQATLLAGVRVEDSSVFGVDTIPRVSASYTLPWLQTKLRGGYATGIRAPKGSVGLTYLGEHATVSFIANVVGAAIDRDFSRPGSPRVTLPGHTKLDLAASYMVAQNVWGIKSLRLQGKIDNLLNEAYEEAFGFSAPGISVRGGITANF